MTTHEMTIDGTRIADDTDCYVIAEVGHNHQGSMETAKAMFLSAKDCGADAVKLQKRDNRSLYTHEGYNRSYNNRNSYGATYGEHREALEFGWDEHIELKRYAAEIGITFFSTAFDFASVEFLESLDIPAFKVASGDLKNIPLLKVIAETGKPMIVSTGASEMEDVERAYEAIMAINPQLCIMQCTAGYPAEFEELDLRVIQMYRERLAEIVVGYSGHDNGISMPLAAYMLGARVIEKHFTLNHTWKGTDHAFSLEPIGMRKMVRDLQRARIAMGDGVKKCYDSEASAGIKMGKKIVAAHDLAASKVLERDDLALKSPGDGLPPYELLKVIGKRLRAAVTADTSLSWEMLVEEGADEALAGDAETRLTEDDAVERGARDH